MQLAEAVQERIIELCEERNITINKLSTDSGISFSTVFSIIYGKSKNTKLATILHICEGLNMELYEFFNSPLFKDVTYEEDSK